MRCHQFARQTDIVSRQLRTCDVSQHPITRNKFSSPLIYLPSNKRAHGAPKKACRQAAFCSMLFLFSCFVPGFSSVRYPLTNHKSCQSHMCARHARTPSSTPTRPRPRSQKVRGTFAWRTHTTKVNAGSAPGRRPHLFRAVSRAV